jgi:hypothetical protein
VPFLSSVHRGRSGAATFAVSAVPPQPVWCSGRVERGLDMTLISVHPGDLRSAAADIDSAAALVAQSYLGPGRDLRVGHHPGWSTETEVAGASQVWTAYLIGLRAAVEASAAAVRAAADTYAASESEAEVVQRRGGGAFFA